MSATRQALLALAITLAACGGVGAPCVQGACPEGTVCDFDGTCRPLEPVRSVGFTEVVALDVTDSASVGGTDAGRVHQSDALAVGGRGDARAHLAFELPERSRGLERATLVLHAHPGFAHASNTATLSAIQTGPFDSGTLTARTAPRAWGSASAARTEAPPSGRPLRLDVSDIVARSDAGPLYLRVEMANGGEAAPWRFASHQAMDVSRRPRLELLLR